MRQFAVRSTPGLARVASVGVLLLLGLLGACSEPEPGTIVGDLYLALGPGRELNFADTEVRLVEDFDLTLIDQLDSLLAPICVERNRRIRSALGTPGEAEALEGASRWAWAERERLLEGRTLRRVRTSPRATFVFDSVPPGKYRLWADTELEGERWSWLARVSLGPGDSLRVNLSNANVDDNPFVCRAT